MLFINSGLCKEFCKDLEILKWRNIIPIRFVELVADTIVGPLTAIINN